MQRVSREEGGGEERGRVKRHTETGERKIERERARKGGKRGERETERGGGERE